MTATSGPDSTHAIGRGWSALVAASTALIIVALSLLPFLTPAWVRFEQDRTGVPGLTGFSDGQLDIVAGSLLGDLALWQGDFRVAIDNRSVLNEREMSHLRDVRGVLWGGFALAAAGGLLITIVAGRTRRSGNGAAVWRAVKGGARATTIGVLVIGAFAVLAFPVFFDLFHRLFFSPGTFTFDPQTERLVQLFPFQFWSETTIAIGGVVLALSIGIGWLAAWRAGRADVPGPAAAMGWTGDSQRPTSSTSSSSPATGGSRAAR